MVLDSLQSDEVWIAGEALIDEVSVNNGIAQPFVGGGPANTARALGKLGLNSFLVTGISTDLYGTKIVKELTEDGVNLSFALLSDLATATAKVSIDNSGAANYEFLLEGTSTFDFKFSRLPTGTPSVLHVGSLGTLIEPGASHLFEWAKSIFSPKVYDPNVRPSVLSDRKKYSASVEKWIGICDVLKMSEEDFFWLFDGEIEPADLLELGPSLLVITKGEGGLIGFHDSGFVAVPSVSVKVVDTVGAGDTVGAILVDEIYRNGVKGVLENLENVLIRAAKAAAITCSRAGANPPSRDELDAF